MSSSNFFAPSNNDDRSQPPTQKKLKANNSNCVINNGAENQTVNTSVVASSSSIFTSSSTDHPMTIDRIQRLLDQQIKQRPENQQRLLVQHAQQQYVQSTQLPQQHEQIIQQQVLQVECLNQDYQQMKNPGVSSGEDANKAFPGGSSVVDSSDMRVPFENFPYFLSEKTKHQLVGSCFLHTILKEYSNEEKHRIMLSSPEGFEIYQEKLIMALADYFSSKLLVLDCLENSRDLSSFGNLFSTDVLRFHTRPALLKYTPSTTYLSENVNMSGFSTETSRSSAYHSTLLSLYKNSRSQVLKKDDRVIFTGLKHAIDTASSRGPLFGYRGKVLIKHDDYIVGVRFDLPIFGGHNLNGQCEAPHGFYCNANEVCIDVEDQVHPTFLDIKAKTILFLTHAENYLVENPPALQGLKNLMSRLPSGVCVIASHIQKKSIMDKEEKSNFSKPLVFKLPSDICVIVASHIHKKSMMDKENSDLIKQKSEIMFEMQEMFSELISIDMPEEKKLFDELRHQLDMDSEFLKIIENMAQLERALTQKGLECNDTEALQVADQSLTNKDAEKVINWAVGYELMAHHPIYRNLKFVLSVESILYGLNNLRSAQTDKKKSKPSAKNIATENEFERKILEDTVLHGEIGVKFDDIGAFDNIKDTLKELVILPLQRPELFYKGQLRKPCRGILLFGPPGTGKTMLAKAIATESGANFMNISSSSIVSKWLGDTEKYVRAIFSVASKIAPCVVFIDEVDSLLGMRRGLEHEATRRLKNEFMLNWDGLLSKDTERVLILAATNRPFDLDEAVIRRMPRRIMVSLPDAAYRAKILKVILANEELSPDIDFDAIALMTEGFSGNDLKDLCVSAAHCPVRELLKKEKLQNLLEASATKNADDIRPLKMEDFEYACSQVRASVSDNSRMMVELRQWNENYGEGGSSRKNTSSAPNYFI